MLLQAEAFDPDGSVQEVKFYGNGALLGNAPLGNLTSIDIVSPGNGFQDAPTVTISGGGGQGATATAEINEEGALTNILLVEAGLGYTSPPVVTLSPSNGAIIAASVDTQIVNNSRKIQGTDLYVLDWVPTNPGTYNISAEAIDDDLSSSLVQTDRYVGDRSQKQFAKPDYFL